MKSALVTGATGFAGGALCKRLVSEGYQVTAFVRESSKYDHLENLGVECRKLDIIDKEQVLTKFPSVDLVFHIAAAYRTETVDRAEFERVNVGATLNMLDAAKANGTERFVHCSTVGVQGDIEDPPANEDYRFSPADHYQRSKMEGELAALKAFSHGLPGVVVRPAAIYGPGDLRFLKLFRAIDRRVFIMIGNGKPYYHMVFIDDLINGFLLASENKSALGQVFTIAGPRYSTLNELVGEVAEVLDRPIPWLRLPFQPVYLASVACEKVCNVFGILPPLYPRRVEFFKMSRAFSTEKARSILGYHPQTDLTVGLRITADWYRSQGLL